MILNIIFTVLISKPILLNIWNTPVRKDFDKSVERHEFFSPYVIGYDVMQGSSDGLLAFLDINTGSIYRKSFKIGGFEKTPYFRRGIFYFTTNNGVAFAYSYRANTVLWRYDVGMPINSTPSLCKNILFFSTSNNTLVALDSKTGKELWTKKRELTNPVIKGSASPVCSELFVYSGFTDGHFLAMNIFDGKTIFDKKLNPKTNKFRDVDAKPIFYLNNIIVPSYDGALYSINKENGDIVWKLNYGSSKEPSLENQTLFFSSNDGSLISVNANNGAIIWRKPLYKGGIGTTPIIYKDYIIVGNSNRGIQLYSKENGNFLSEFNSQKGVFADPVVFNDKVLFYSNYGILYAFKIKE